MAGEGPVLWPAGWGGSWAELLGEGPIAAQVDVHDAVAAKATYADEDPLGPSQVTAEGGRDALSGVHTSGTVVDPVAKAIEEDDDLRGEVQELL
jgi:hypothetical protein